MGELPGWEIAMIVALAPELRAPAAGVIAWRERLRRSSRAIVQPGRAAQDEE
jgi:hypothetical protein